MVSSEIFNQKDYSSSHEPEPEKIEYEINALHEILSQELTPELSKKYLTSLKAHLGGVNQTLEAFISKGEAVHQYVGDNLYGPLIVGCTNWILRKCDQMEHQGNVYFALRDAAPLEAAASVLWANNGLHPVGIYANRPILGIEDDISHDLHSDDIQNGLQYLESKGIHENGSIILVDSGAWGTIVKLMKQTILKDTDLYPFFWYSHNPNIPGYLNRFLKESGLPEKALETINDSLECMFLQPNIRPTKTVESENGRDVILEPSVLLATVWGEAALRGVKQAAYRLQGIVPQEMEIARLKMLAELSSQANITGEWTGVLPENTPTWPSGAVFLSKWPVDLLP